MEVFIRKAQICDIPDLINMNEIVNANTGCTIETMTSALENNKNEIVFVAIYSNTAVGFICGQLLPSICYANGMQCEVTELFVRESYRRKGIAGMLITALEKEFESHNAQEILLQASGRNMVAQRFYEKAGYYDTKRIVYRKKEPIRHGIRSKTQWHNH